MKTSPHRWLVLALPLCVACTKPTSRTDRPADVCVKEGQQCTYAEGKIGLCTASAGSLGVASSGAAACDGGPCLTCMSLH
jgi:hypothetical protein